MNCCMLCTAQIKPPSVSQAFLISLDDRNVVEFLCSLNICFQIKLGGGRRIMQGYQNE